MAETGTGAAVAKTSGKDESEEVQTPEAAPFLSRIAGSLRMLLVFLVICSAAYPGALQLVGSVLFRENARGGIARLGGRPVGAELIGQPFSSENFFHPRPSSTGYDGMDSGSSNLGPYNPALAARVKELLRRLAEGGIAAESVPVGWVTESGSALDPHISPAAARLQIERVSRATGIPGADLEQLIEKNTEGKFLGVFGRKRVNVLLLNLDVRNYSGRM